MTAAAHIESLSGPGGVAPRQGLRRRLLAAFIGLSALVVIAAAIAFLSLWMTRQNLDTISNNSIPIATTSLDLTRVAQQIVDTVPALVAAPERDVQADLTTRLGSLVERLSDLLETMRGFDVDPRAAASIERSAMLFATNIEAINRMVSARIAVEEDLKQKIDSALGATSRIVANIDQYTVDRSEGLARVLEADPLVVAQRLRLLRARAEAREIELLLQSFTGQDTAGFTGLARASLDDIRMVLSDVDADDRAALGADLAILDEVFSGGANIGQQSAFRQQLAAAADQALGENRDLGDRFSDAVDRMITVAKADVDEAKAAAAEVQTAAFSLLTSVVVATLVSSFLIVRVYVHRNILARLTALTGSMMAIANGDLSAEIPAATEDELGSMAAALRVFRDTAVEVRDSNLREIQETRSRLYHAIENIQEGFALFDAQGRMTLANRPFGMLLLGSDRDLPAGESYEALLTKMAATRIDTDAVDAWLGCARAYHDAPIGTQIWQLTGKSWVGATERRTDDGGSVMVVTDLTEIKRHEQELDDLVEKLQKASAAKSSFVANVSHELRTPLTAVLGFARIAQNRFESVIFPNMVVEGRRTERAVTQIRENFEIMIAEGQRLTKMINDILDLEKIEAGQMIWDIEPLDMGSVIRQAAAATNSLYTSKGLAFHIDVEPDLPPVAGDRDRVVQVVINLISNAVKFTDRGHVACVAKKGAGPFVSVSVSDTGVGIAPEDQSEVFDKFRQVGDTLTEKPSGTGLGLPICREIVEHLGGSITVDSMRGYGSTFTFQLPLADTGAVAIQPTRRHHGD